MDTRKTVIVMPELTQEQKKRLEAFSGFRFVYDPKPGMDKIRNASVIMGNLPPAVLQEAKALEFLQLTSSGADAYCKPGVLKEGTLLASATGAYNQSVAEHAFAATLCLMKNLHLYRDDQFQKIWSDHGKVGTLRGATVLIAGLGDIGVDYAAMVKAMGAYVIGVKRRPAECPACVDELHLTGDLEELLPRADVVCSILPGTEATWHLFDREHFGKMKKSAIFINVGRGTAQDEEALIEALRDGTIAAASVDVTEKEPLAKESGLWELPNLLLTPHVAGGAHMDVTLDLIAEICVSNFEKFAEGKPVRNEIDFSTGYKK
ncbi:MAG: D-2-hydroxyacid dehydrogenase [Lachnospiraceae bacterium]|nr:D-2-hydroxyacid dehydrogenase [Lachnospiraceae bacterium]